jgi:hypothetical protein
VISFLKFGALTWIKVTLGCRFGFHRWTQWEHTRPLDRPVGYLTEQRRACLDCPKGQRIFCSDERLMRESWRDR